VQLTWMYWRSLGLAFTAPGGREPPFVRLPSVMAAGREMPSLPTSVAWPSADFSPVSEADDGALPMLARPAPSCCYVRTLSHTASSCGTSLPWWGPSLLTDPLPRAAADTVSDGCSRSLQRNSRLLSMQLTTFICLHIVQLTNRDP